MVSVHHYYLNYKSFLSALADANSEYSARVASGNTTEKKLHSLAWNVDDLSRLNENGRKYLVEVQTIADMTKGPRTNFIAANVPHKLTSLRNKLETFLQGVYRFRRTAATHIFVFMISPEQRETKPYALPVQCVPYVSLKDNQCRQMTSAIIGQMDKRGMKVTGV